MAGLAELRGLWRGLWLLSGSQHLLGNECDPMRQELITQSPYNCPRHPDSVLQWE